MPLHHFQTNGKPQFTLSKSPDLGIRALNFNQAAPESSPYAHSPQPATLDQASPFPEVISNM